MKAVRDATCERVGGVEKRQTAPGSDRFILAMTRPSLEFRKDTKMEQNLSPRKVEQMNFIHTSRTHYQYKMKCSRLAFNYLCIFYYAFTLVYFIYLFLLFFVCLFILFICLLIYLFIFTYFNFYIFICF